MSPSDSSRDLAKLQAALFAAALCSVAMFGGCARFDAQRATVAETFSDKRVRALVEAAEKGDVATVDALVEEGVNVNAKGRGSVTPLLRCLFQKNKEGYEALLRHGAEPDIPDARGSAVTHKAAREEDSFWLRLALEHGANPNLINTGHTDSRDSTPLYYAIHGFDLAGRGAPRASGRVESVKLLIAAGADVNHKLGTGTFPLREAAEAGNYEIVFLLLEAGADFRQKDRSGHTLAEWIGRRTVLPKDMFDRVIGESQRPWFQKVVEFLEAKGEDLTSKKKKVSVRAERDAAVDCVLATDAHPLLFDESVLMALA